MVWQQYVLGILDTLIVAFLAGWIGQMIYHWWRYDRRRR